jgi:hypothetical protein
MTVNNLENRGKVWLDEELGQLKREFAANEDLEEIAARHGRSPLAIAVKLEQMWLIVNRGGDYYRIEQDPWITEQMLKRMNRKLGEQ